MARLRTSDCSICGAALAQAATGRPRRYCSTTCRRMAERKIKVAEQLLTRARKAEQDARERHEMWPAPGGRKRADWWAAEVARLEIELRGLLLDDQDADAEGGLSARWSC